MPCLALSCQDEDLKLNPNEVSNNFQNETVVNGRFFFSSKESLKKTMEKFKTKERADLEVKFEKLYLQGFSSHSPIVNPDNGELISKKNTTHRTYEKNSSITEEEDNTIADPFFAAVVNQNNEIIVGDSIYKITKDLGMLFVHIRDTTHLYNYLKTLSNNKISTTGKSASSQLIEPCIMRTQYGGITRLDPKISRYIAPDDGGGCGDGGGGGSTPTPTPVPQISPEEQLQNQINNLPICNGDKTSLFQSIFGTNLSCINYFDSSHRIKTEYWNQSWLIYKSVGVEVRTQVKTLGIWWASEADEIHLGINRVYMRYNYPEPQINYFNSYYSNPEVPVYMYKGEFKFQQYAGIYTNAPFVAANTALPFFNFGGDILNIYIRRLPFLDNYDINSQSNIKALYKLGIDFLKNNFNSGASKEFVVSYQKNSTEIEVVYFGERYRSINDNQIKRTFYQDTEFVISAAYSSSGGSTTGDWNYTVKPPEVSNFRTYTYFELDFYGLARKGNTWSGNRMIHN